ncbi:MAG: hypothetical protein A2252_03205 [Elusimicrobia bacterium RIFOXYA2_FULL_39_19]|nr:MAG: hypothetical protein A2252_03205 [Elusimicrobia bacterium RIFOXYA2_FULL_39_19]
MSILKNAYLWNFIRNLVILPFEPGLINGDYTRIIKNELALTDDETLIDIGCGTGRTSNICTNYTGVDANEQFIKYAIKKHNKTFFAMDASRLNFKDKSFDKAVILETMHHVPNDVFINSLNEAKRVTRKMIILADPIKQSKNNLFGRMLIANDLGKYVREKEKYISMIASVLDIDKAIPFKVGVTQRLLVKCLLK